MKKKPKTFEEEIQDMKDFVEETSSSREKSLEFLQQAGILDKNGELNPWYK